ncbi:MAG: S-methyl-5-thioribose-1-phosphate isomerase [Myxococcales bacterium]|nr:S-methyl-5-thioribose-1-phosphate isomerase [Myxococcales bacterium]
MSSIEGRRPGDWFTLRWFEGALELLDQRLLPDREEYLRLTQVEAVAAAIESLAVRGAPAIGCTAAFGIVCAANEIDTDDVAELCGALDAARKRLTETRPTAVNLSWALRRMAEVWSATPRGRSAAEIRAALLVEAQKILVEDVAACRAIGAEALPLVPERARILTHCNAGALATAGYGTALGVVRAAREAGREVTVLADETRPFLQGARLTAWELARDGIPVTVVTDNMAGHLMSRGDVDLVVVGADRIAGNGDVANKIGTYTVAVLAREHGIPFCVAAPRSTIDLETVSGAAIPIEERGRREVAEIGGQNILPEGVPVRHPAFDVTPAALVAAIVTEVGIARAPYDVSLAALMRK